MPIATLNCPTCGAAVSSDATQCQYCGARLATVACPSCFGLAFIGSKFCPHCGKELVKPEDLDTTLKCPRCRTERMQEVTLKDTKVLECPKCCGLWLTSATFDFICNNAERQEAVLAFDPPPVQAPAPGGKVLYLPCPKCGDLMNRLNFAHRSGVIIDICKKDGIWFDRDGLRHIIEFIRAGGMERSHLIEREELADQVRSVNVDAAAKIREASILDDAHVGEVYNAFAVAGTWLERALEGRR